MSERGKAISREEWLLVLAILFLAFASFLIRAKVSGLSVPLLFFIGIPTLLAVIIVASGQATTLVGKYLKNTTLGLLLVGILAADQFAFLLVMAPISWFLAYVAAVARSNEERPKTNSPAAPAAIGVPPASPEVERDRIRKKKFALVGICLTFTIISLLGRMIYARHLETTSLLFVGIPSIVAILLALTVRPKSALGSAMIGTTFVLLLSAILFGEGVICILMAAPIFYLVSGIIGFTIDNARSRRDSVKLLLVSPLLLISMEGLHKRLELSREQTVSSQAIVAASADHVRAALSAPMQFRTDLPFYLKLGFPRPVSARGSGLAGGDRRVIHFAGGEGKPGDLELEVEEATSGRVVFRAVSDQSHVAHWLHWEDAVVSWHPVDGSHTEVNWSLHYRRGLDPAWYFDPWERYGVRLAVDYLIDNLVTPDTYK